LFSSKAVAGLARCYLKSGDLERAKTTLQLVRPDAAGPYRLECAPDGKFVLCEAAQQIRSATTSV